MPTVNEEILLILISAHVANYVISIWERGGWTEYCDRDYIQTSIVIMGLTRLGYNFTDYLLHYILSTEADTHANCSPGHNPREGGSGSDPASCLSAGSGHPGLTS